MEIKKVVKGFTGGFRRPKGNEDFTNVILDVEAYQSYLDKIDNLKLALVEANDSLESQNKQHKNDLLKYKAEYESEIKDLLCKIELKEKHITTQINTNENLIRIVRERANAQRKLQPKKQHTGYVLLSSDEFIFNYKLDRKTLKLPCWSTKLQSPYDVTIDIDSFNNLFIQDLIKSLKKVTKINDIYKNNSDINKIWNKETNFIFDRKYRINGIKGFWEVQFLTKYPIGVDRTILPTNE